jgi:radial spoke head protein 4/6
VSDNKTVYQWAGINIGEHNSMLLQKALCSLAKASGASKLRFWGKIHGTEKDYYIAEGVAEAQATEEEKPADSEPRGTGANEFAYWVCNSPDENKWTALPDLTTADIAIARQIKFHFSGDLERRIITNPFFHKLEKHYLRAQIARISLGTTLVPKGMYRTTEDNPMAIEDNTPEEGPIPIPTTSDMGKPDFWVHFPQSLLKCCRTTLLEAEVPEGVEDVEAY